MEDEPEEEGEGSSLRQTLARQTIVNFLERAIRLHEQEPVERWGSPVLESYVTRWRRWAMAGLYICVGHCQ